MRFNIKMPRNVPFESLNYGNIFYAGDGVHIKIIPLGGNNSYNAVDLRDGSLEYFVDGELVNKLDSELNAEFMME